MNRICLLLPQIRRMTKVSCLCVQPKPLVRAAFIGTIVVCLIESFSMGQDSTGLRKSSALASGLGAIEKTEDGHSPSPRTEPVVPLLDLGGQRTGGDSSEASIGVAKKEIAPLLSLNAKLHVPKTIITQSVNRDYTETSPVNRTVLGTRSNGIAICRSSVAADLLPNPNAAEIRCTITGSVQSYTTGVNGPATICSRSTTNFTAIKSMLFNGVAFYSPPARIQSSTKLSIDSVTSNLPGLRGKIVQRVGTKRARDSHSEAQTITGCIALSELQQRIDKEFNKRVDELNRELLARQSILDRFTENGRKLKVTSHAGGLEISYVSDASIPHRSLPIRRLNGLSDKVELWIHISELQLDTTSMDGVFENLRGWLQTNILEATSLRELTDKEIGIALREGWFVFGLQDTIPRQ